MYIVCSIYYFNIPIRLYLPSTIGMSIVHDGIMSVYLNQSTNHSFFATLLSIINNNITTYIDVV